MKTVYCIASNITTALGTSTGQVWNAVMNGQSGVEEYRSGTSPVWASKLSESQWATMNSVQNAGDLSPFEQLALYSAHDAISRASTAFQPQRTLFILTTTKGNIEWLGKVPDARNGLHRSASIISQSIGLSNAPVTISHACVSGVTGLIYGLRALQAGRWDTAIVTGADRLTDFVISGFASFQALADGRCKPFDAARSGINLGEGAATIILSTSPGDHPLAIFRGGTTSNDANHISGPSRTGEELTQAIDRTLSSCGLEATDIDFISAHGTATMYNDEMEAKAFAHAGLLHASLHSLKGYFGHTLGAAGVLESALLIESIRHERTIPSLGFEHLGVSQPVNMCRTIVPLRIRNALKTASGFGGCNAAVVWSRA